MEYEQKLQSGHKPFLGFLQKSRSYGSLPCTSLALFKQSVIFGFVMSREVQNKYPTLCSHDFQKSLTNQIDLHCNQDPSLLHKVSQFGKICNKCTQIIKDSYCGHGDCIVCADTIEQYLKDRQLCQHEIREFDEVQVKCLADPTVNHDVPFRSPICKKCTDKVRAAFMNSKVCKICEGREGDVIRDLEKVFISPSYSHIKNVLALLQAANAPTEAYKNEIESACKALPRVVRQESPTISQKMVDEYNSGDSQDAHISKRYKLYPKCRKHRSNFISVCNACLVALLNLDCCPYGCQQQGKAQTKVKKEANVKYFQTGFLNIYPQLSKHSYYLELFVIKLIEEKARLDRWQVSIKKISPKSPNEEKYIDRFAFYSSVVAVSKNDYFVCGGVAGKTLDSMRPTANSFVISISTDRKEFQIIEIPPMGIPRSGHSLIYNQTRKMVFAVGGYNKENGYLKETQVYSIQNRQWFPLGNLSVERSKATGCIHQGNVYVFGGLTNNAKINEIHAERFSYESQKWEPVSYNGYDVPFTTNSTPSSSLRPFQNKDTLLFFGGANTLDKTCFIQKLLIKGDSFQIDFRNRMQMQFDRQACILGLINEDTLICFGGIREYEPLLNIDAIKLNPSQKQVNILYVNDEIQLGSYRSIAREDSEKFYTRIKEDLKRLGLLSQQEKELMKEEGLVTPFNCHLLEKLWFSVGKSYVWVPL